MGKRSSYAIDVRNRHPYCSALSYDEWERLYKKIGAEATIDLGIRVNERDRMLENGRKSVPKHRLNPRGPHWV